MAGKLFGFRYTPGKGDWSVAILERGTLSLRSYILVPSSSFQYQGEMAKFKSAAGQGGEFKPVGGTESVTGRTNQVPASQSGFSGTKGAGLLELSTILP